MELAVHIQQDVLSRSTSDAPRCQGLLRLLSALVVPLTLLLEVGHPLLLPFGVPRQQLVVLNVNSHQFYLLTTGSLTGFISSLNH